MGYFSNGTEGDIYRDTYCKRCLHYLDTPPGQDCAVWGAHLLYNRDFVNNPANPLNILIPLSADGLDNEQCLMFIQHPDYSPPPAGAGGMPC